MTAPPAPLAALILVLALALPGSAAAARAPSFDSPDDVPAEGRWPLQPRPEVVARFDPPETTWGAGHRGVDLRGSAAQPVRAALAGRVTFAGRLAGRGVVVVAHGDTRTTYEPVGASRSVGDQVAAGERIGALETVGSHCFPATCLHWGWLRGETYLDPLLLVGAGPVRLLPLWREAPVPAVAVWMSSLSSFAEASRSRHVGYDLVPRPYDLLDHHQPVR